MQTYHLLTRGARKISPGFLRSFSHNGRRFEIIGYHLPGRPAFNDLPMVQPKHAFAETLHCEHAMTDKQDSSSFLRYFAHLSQTFFLERNITDRQHFVHD